MAGKKKNYFRKKVMEEWGRERKNQPFVMRELKRHMNTYLNTSGRRHRFTQVASHTLTNLLAAHPKFMMVGFEADKDRSLWKYIGDEEE